MFLLGYNHPCFVADVAQLVRAPDCGPGGRGFNSHHSPQILNGHKGRFLILINYAAVDTRLVF